MHPFQVLCELPAFAASQSVQSTQFAEELLIGSTATSFENGMTDTYTSPGFAAVDCNWLNKFLVAVLRADSLPLSAIEPVLSRTSATLRRELPHLTVEDTLT